MGKLSGRTVVVTGGTRGLGEAIVRGIVLHGGRVVFGGRDVAAGRAIEKDLGGEAIYVRQDVTEEADWERVVATARERFRGVNGLVNNAGLMGILPVADLNSQHLTEIIGVNQIGPLLGIKHCVRAMRREGGGSIVNIASSSARKGNAEVVVYSAAKASIIGMTHAAAIELAPENIRVNLIHPGFFGTSMLEGSMGSEGYVVGAQATPMNRIGRPEEIVGPVVFLLSDDSSFVTGVELAVDGGLTS